MGKRSRRKGLEAVPGPPAGEPAEGADGRGPEPASARDPEAAAPPAGEARPAPGAADLADWQAITAAADRIMVLYHAHRWALAHGRVPTPEDWERDRDWPSTGFVEGVYASWAEMIADSGIEPLVARLQEGEAERRAAVEEARRATRSAEKELGRVAELRRQLERAQEVRDVAQAEAAQARADNEALVARAERAERRSEEAHRRADETVAAAERHRAPGEEVVPRAEHQAALAALDAERAEHARLDGELHEAREALRVERQAVRRLSQLLAQGGEDMGEEDAAPAALRFRTVEEATRAAAEDAQHLRFASRAFESAADSPFRRPRLIYDALRKLDELAELYSRPEGIGRSIGQVAEHDLGLVWRGDVSTLARSRRPNDYRATYEGVELPLGPHVNLGAGSGAGEVARIYLYMGEVAGVGDRLMVVGHVGRHLPDTTT